MTKNVSFYIFSVEEEKRYLYLQKIKDKFFLPLCQILKNWNVSPDTLSFLGLFMIVPFVYFFPFNPWLAFIFLLINCFFDLSDGSLARFLGKQSKKGDFLDHSFDYAGFFIVLLTFIYYNAMSPFWGAVYLLNYVILLAFIAFCRANNIVFFPAIRSKYFFYLFFFVFLVTGNSYFDPFLVLLSVYMTVTNIFLFHRIRCSL